MYVGVMLAEHDVADVVPSKILLVRSPSPQKASFWGAAGPGFEPGLSDSELISAGSPLFAHVPQIAYLSQILRFHVTRRSPLFARVTVKPLSNRGTT